MQNIRYQNTSIDKVIEISNIMKWITSIDPIAIQPFVTVCKYMEQGNISTSSWFDFTLLHICTFTPIYSRQMYAKY